jgi:hypothetical protein
LRGLAVVAGALALATPAFAQASDPAAADALFRKGREAAEKGDWATACPKFAESQRLDPAPGTLLNLADCEEKLGHLASAYEHFKTALETMAANDDRIPFAKRHIASVEKLVPHLTLSASPDLPANARVMRDDVELGSASFGLAIPVDPGAHAVVVLVPGHVERRVNVSLKPGEAQTIALHAGDVAASASAEPAAAPSPAPAASGATTTSAGDPRRTLGLVLGAVGVAGIAVGAVTGGLVLGKKSIVDDPSHCDQTTHACDQTGTDAASAGQTLSTVSTVTFIGGGAVLAAGVILFFTSPARAQGASGAAARTTFVPEAYLGGGGLRVIHAF